jgi:alkylation response protein AidB-like acyl-CoA dehydrogenase
MDFGFSEEQDMLRQSARDFLVKESPMTYVRRMMEDDRGFSDDQWNKMAELGWMGLILPEQYGGSGLDFVDMVVVLEEMGRVVLPGPFFSTVILGGVALLEGGTDAQKKDLLPKLAAGKLRMTLAQLEPNARWDGEGVQLEAKKDGAGWKLSGTKLFVPDAHTADVLVVAARTTPGSKGADGVSLLLVDAKAPGISTTLLKTMDQTRKLCEVGFKDVAVAGDRLLGTPGQGWKLLDRVVDRGKVGICAEMCGGAQKVLEMSVEYAKVREQFGKPIGSFQAIQHKCANMLVEVESSKSATYYAAWAVANDVAEAPLAAAMAKAYTSDAYRHTAGEGIQIHGGIGFTWEHDMHIYFKRAKSSEVTFGDATWNRELVAQLINL